MSIESYLNELMNEEQFKHGLKAGDKVKLDAMKILKAHARSVPAHMGYTTEQFSWKRAIDNLDGKIGTVQRVFDSGNVNFEYDGDIYHIPKGIGLEPVTTVKESKVGDLLIDVQEYVEKLIKDGKMDEFQAIKDKVSKKFDFEGTKMDLIDDVIHTVANDNGITLK